MWIAADRILHIYYKKNTNDQTLNMNQYAVANNALLSWHQLQNITQTKTDVISYFESLATHKTCGLFCAKSPKRCRVVSNV